MTATYMAQTLIYASLLVAISITLGGLLTILALVAVDRRIRRRHGLRDEAAVTRALNAYEGGA